MVERGGEVEDRIWFLDTTAEPELFVLIVLVARGRVRWELGPKELGSPEELTRELKRIYDDRSTWYRAPGGDRPPDVRLRHGPEVTYGDMALTMDAVTAAGFEQVGFYRQR